MLKRQPHSHLKAGDLSLTISTPMTFKVLNFTLSLSFNDMSIGASPKLHGSR
jgi:hypothetical protein